MTARDGLQMAGVALDAIGLIDKLVHAGAIDSAKSLLVSLRDGIDGVTSPQVVMAHMDTLREKLADADAAADSALTDRFK